MNIRKNQKQLLMGVFLVFILGIPLLNIVQANSLLQETCPSAPQSRLIIGEQGQVSDAGANNLRSQPSTNGLRNGQIPAGGIFIVLEGPVCADGFAWWRVDYNGLIAWTAEGQGDEYWLNPLGPISEQQTTITATATSSQTGDEVACPGFLPSRLIVGEQGRVIPGPANNMRVEPISGAELITEIPGGASFFVLEGPICEGGLAWWRVDYNGTTGWTAEGSDNTYWLEPTGPLPTPAPTLTPSNTYTPIPTSTPRPTLTPSLTPTQQPIMPTVTVAENLGSFISRPIPNERESITSTNVNRLELLSIVGQGKLQEIAITPDGSTLVILNSLGVWLADLNNDNLILLNTPEFLPNKIAVSPDGRYLAMGSEGYNDMVLATIQVWDLSSRTQISIFRDFDQPIYELEFSPNSQWLVAGSQRTINNQQNQSLIWVMNIEEESLRSIEMPFTTRITSMSFSPDSELIAIASFDGMIELYNLAIDEHQIAYDIQGTFEDITFSPDGASLITIGSGGTTETPTVLRVWDIATSERLYSPQLAGYFTQLTLNSDSTMAILGLGGVQVWDTTTMTQITEFDIPPRPVSIASKPDGQLIIAHDSGVTYQWNLEVRTNELLLDFDGPTTWDRFRVSPDGNLIAMISSRHEEIRLWDNISAEFIGTFGAIFDYVGYLGFNQDATGLNFTVGDRRYTWDIESGTQEQTTEEFPQSEPQEDNREELLTIARSFYLGYTPSLSAMMIPNTSLMIVDEGEILTIWDIETRTPLLRQQHFGEVVTFSADNTLMITRTDGAYWLWGIPQ